MNVGIRERVQKRSQRNGFFILFYFYMFITPMQPRCSGRQEVTRIQRELKKRSCAQEVFFVSFFLFSFFSFFFFSLLFLCCFLNKKKVIWVSCPAGTGKPTNKAKTDTTSTTTTPPDAKKRTSCGNVLSSTSVQTRYDATVD